MHCSFEQVRTGMDERLSIRINIADRYYPLKIDRNDEEKIRKAARTINEKVLQYKQKYTDKDTQDFLAMAALQFVMKVIDGDDSGSGIEGRERRSCSGAGGPGTCGCGGISRAINQRRKGNRSGDTIPADFLG